MIKRKVVSIALAGILMISMLAGCGSPEGNKDAANTEAAPETTQETQKQEAADSSTAGDKEEITLSIVWCVSKGVAPDHGPVNRLLKDKFNINVEWTDIGSSTPSEQLNLLFSTGEFPELIWNYNGEKDIKRWASQGYLIPASDYYEKLPNYRALYTDDEWNEMLTYASNSDGKVYYTPNKNYRSASQAWLYRMGMLEELGKSVPATTEELYDLLKAYKEAYPDSIPIANRWGFNNLLGGFALAFRTNTNLFFDPDTQQLAYGPATDKYRDMLIYVEKLYAEGLIDPEFQTATDTQWEEIYANGLNIAEYSYTNRAVWANNAMINADPDADWQWVDTFITAYPDKEALVSHELSYQNTGGFVMTKALSDEKLERWLEFADWAVSEEGQRWFSMGEEGITYEMADGKPVLLPEIYSVSNPEGKTLEQLGYGYFLIRAEESLEQIGYADDLKLSRAIAGKEYLKTVAYNLTEEQEKSLIDPETQINDIFQEYTLRFITGSLDPSDDGNWNEYLERLQKAGLDEVLNTRRTAVIVAK